MLEEEGEGSVLAISMLFSSELYCRRDAKTVMSDGRIIEIKDDFCFKVLELVSTSL